MDLKLSKSEILHMLT